MKKFKGYLPLALLALAAITMAAGVNGVFNSVNSALGYKVAGGAGTTGQALCSNGTIFNTACPIPGAATLYYQTVDSAGVAQTQRSALDFGSEFTLSDSASPSKTSVGLVVTQTDYTGSRSFATPYTASGVPTQVEVTVSTLAASECTGAGIHATALVGPTSGTMIQVLSGSITNDCLGTIPLSFLVPAGYSYEVDWATNPSRTTPNSVVIANWTELTW
jgi:hypothetical protein